MHRTPKSPSPRSTASLFRMGLVLALLLGLAASVAQAQLARVSITITDMAGEPLKGADITATTDGRAFEETQTTNKKGVAKFAFIDGTVTYKLTIEKEGYITREVPLKPKIGVSMRETYELVTPDEAAASQIAAGDAQAMADSGPKKRYTPAQLAFNDGVEALKTQDYDSAEVQFKQALELDAELNEAHSALASVYIEKGKADEALFHAQAFAAVAEESPRSYRLLYEAHRLAGNSEEADKALKQMSKLADSGDAAALRFNEGLAAIEVGDFENAEQHLLAAIEAQPDLHDAVQALAILSINQKNYQRAAEMAERFLAARPGDVKLLKIRWDAYSGLGDEAKTKEAFEQLAAADPSVVVKQLFEAAQNQFNSGNTEQAIAGFQQILQLDPDHPGSHYQLGLCFVNQGDNAKAKEYLGRFLEIAPNDPQAPAAKDMLGFL